MSTFKVTAQLEQLEVCRPKVIVALHASEAEGCNLRSAQHYLELNMDYALEYFTNKNIKSAICLMVDGHFSIIEASIIKLKKRDIETQMPKVA